MIRFVLAILVTYVISQIIKVIVTSVKAEAFEWEVIFFAGGMPSVHSTFVSALVTSLYLFQGFTPLFIAALVFAFLVVYDAMTLRRTVGEHAVLLRKLYARMEKKGVELQKKGGVGHSFVEVVAGVLLGIIIPIVVFYV